MGSVVFTKQYSTGTYTPEMRVRISYSESYNSSTNKTTVALTDVELYSSVMFSTIGMPLFGKVKFNGTVVADFEGGTSDTVAMADSYSSADYSGSYGSITVEHSSDGKASVIIGVDVGDNWSASGTFGAWPYTYDSGHIYGVDAPNSQTVSLTDRGHTLTTTVSPSGYGTVTSGATLASGKTKSLTATPAATTAQYIYAFSRWSNNAGALTSETANPTTFTMGSSDATVTANFTRTVRSYTVSCQDRVGSSSGTLLGTKTASYTYGSSVSGASFGSSASYDAYYTGYHYIGSSSAITVDGNETVYRYFALNTWTVSYNANGGSGAPSSQTKTYNVNLTLSSTVPTRTGYDFLGWSTSSTATAATYLAGGTYTANAGAILYAVWRLKTYMVSYDANGGTGAPASQTKTYGVALTLSSTKPTRSNSSAGSYTVTYRANYSGGTNPAPATAARTTSYHFLFWNTWRSGGGTTYAPGSSYTVDSSANMYAQWGSITSTASVTLPTMTRTGYTFKGWSTDASASTGTTGKYTPSGNVTLYAIWQLKTFTLSISQGAGSTITVTRDGTQLSNGATIAYFDSLAISISANTGYNLGTHTVNGTTWTTGQLSVSSAVSVVSTASKKTYTLRQYVSSSGVSVNVLRTASPIGGAPNGLLNNGATLYHNDVLTASFTVSHGYMLETATVNGVDFSSAGTYTFTVTQDAVVTVEVDVGGIVYIGNGTTWEPYQVFIGDGRNWNRYQAYIGNGSSWEAY